jgi:hypothetical protein
MHVDGEYLIFVINGWDYDIPMRDLETEKGLEGWLKHMNEKVWFKEKHQNNMIKICEEKFNYKFTGKTHYEYGGNK